MNSRINDAAFRLPTEPYPGLRPFLDHEAALLLGRGLQVAEIIARLGETHFVAVIGGSGSGKSSLIRAGVVPELRGLGIPDAGDYWVPVVCTPGTTPAGEARATAPAQTPITRLAWKLSQQLEPADQAVREATAAYRCEHPDAHIPDEVLDLATEEASRRADIAAAFAQGAGFARLVEAYSDELPARGPLRANARFLFVIDQFEELFHPNNEQNADAHMLVEAVIEHFQNPHPRCFVVLTMRSEHLADCAGYLELPDAINKSSYLLRRLDDGELREAIVGPAKVFLRLAVRGHAPGEPDPPRDVRFDEHVIRRLLADVAKISADPDHLPLLQHVLARAWDAACARSARPHAKPAIPDSIGWSDLEQAVDPSSSEPPGWLREKSSINVLRSSLDNWADATWRARPLEEQKSIDVVLRHLAFKDLNNGQYTQQRLEVDDPTLFPGVVKPRAMLGRLLEHGFLDTVNYLFWDRENPDRVTLKVSHESFIRGWDHFRTLIDFEAERFEEFVAVLRRCVRWDAGKRPEELLEASELLRFESAGLAAVFTDKDVREDWFAALLKYRDGERLAKAEPLVDKFLEVSRSRVKWARGTRNLGWAVAALCLTFAPFLWFAFFVQRPVLQAVYKFTDARMLMDFGGHTSHAAPVGAAASAARTLTQAAKLFDEAQSQTGFIAANDNTRGWLAGWFRPMTPMRRLFLETSPESQLNGQLRDLLTTQVWRVPGDSDDAPIPLARVRKEQSCAIEGQGTKGSLFYDTSSQHGAFFPTPASDTADIELYLATLKSGHCEATRLVWSIPQRIAPLVAIDSQLHYLAVAQTLATAGNESVTLYKFFWNQGDLELLALSVVIGQDAVQVVQDEFKRPERAGAAPANVAQIREVATWPAFGGMDVSVGDHRWRLISNNAQKLALDDAELAHWHAFDRPRGGSPCAALEQTLVTQAPVPGFRLVDLLQHGKYCFAIQRGSTPQRPGAAAPGAVAAPAPGGDGTEQLMILVYPEIMSTQPGGGQPGWLASFTFFDQAAAPSGSDKWLVADSGRYGGWIALRAGNASKGVDYFATPWSTSALDKLAKQVDAPWSATSPVAATTAVAGSTPPASRAGATPISR